MRNLSGTFVKSLVIGYLVLLLNSSYLAGYADPTSVSYTHLTLPTILRV